MSGPKHTPGPWEVRRGRDGYIRQVVGPKGRIVSRWNGLAAPTSNEGEANALLIAAAPRLAEALERLLGLVDELHPNGFPEGFWPHEAVAAARAALREAGVEP